MLEHRNYSRARLVELALKRDEGVLSDTGALIVHTGKYTGRSPRDKFTVSDALTETQVWFNDGNQPMAPEHAQALYDKIANYLAQRDRFVVDCRAGASDTSALQIKITTERAWHALFARNMFIDHDPSKANKEPSFSVIHAPGFKADRQLDHTNSEAAIILDFSKRRVIICGTEYAGEIKKSIFSVLNFLLPNKGILGMHSSANKNSRGDVAVFFGLSGTGKTTLSAEASRSLIGDDEHGWDEQGIFNFEGGCYAKAIHLSAADEPEIYRASRQFTSIVENVVYDPSSRKLNLDDASITENTRASYDISFIPNACLTGKGGHPQHVIMLTCDAFGVLPPLARLSSAAATYHFISGYTAKVAGTERGVTEPKATFSACFGAPFMIHFPGVYAKLLQEKINRHQVQCWLVNTGWTGGPYGVGSRMKISITRRLLHAVLDGELSNACFRRDPIFNIDVPLEVNGLSSDILLPESTWNNASDYRAQAHKLAQLFHDNFKPYSALVSEEVRMAAPITL